MRLASSLRRFFEWKYFLPACLALAFMLRLAWVLVAHTEPVNDWKWYFDRATALAYGEGYVFRGELTAYWPVGWPAVLAAVFSVTGPSIFAGQMTNVILYLGIITVCYYLGRELFRSRLTGAIAALLLAVYPNHIAYCAMLCSETQYTFLTLLGILLTVLSRNRAWMLLLAGAILGLAILTREQGYFVPLIAGLLLPARGESISLRCRLRAALMVILAAVAAVLPWTIRNYTVFGRIVPVSTNLGINLWTGNNPYQTGSYCLDPRMLSDIEREDSPTGECEWDDACKRHAIRYVISHPLRTLRFAVIKGVKTYRWDWDGICWGTPDSRPARIMKTLCKGYYAVVMAVFGVGLVAYAWSRKRMGTMRLPTIGLWLTAYWLAGNLIAYGYPRYHYAAMPWVIIYVAAFVSSSFPSSKIKQDEALLLPPTRAEG